MSNNAIIQDTEFYNSLLTEVKLAYTKRNNQNSIQLYYSIAATPIMQNSPVLLGINWGGSGTGFEPQHSMPELNIFLSELNNGVYKFLTRSEVYLKKYKQFDLYDTSFNYSNLCFFRSQKEKDLSVNDYEDCFPIFKKYLNYINPPYIISFGVNNVTRLKNIKNSKIQVRQVYDNDNKFSGYLGSLQEIPFYCVPHPNARISNESREQIWNGIFC